MGIYALYDFSMLDMAARPLVCLLTSQEQPPPGTPRNDSQASGQRSRGSEEGDLGQHRSVTAQVLGAAPVLTEVSSREGKGVGTANPSTSRQPVVTDTRASGD